MNPGTLYIIAAPSGVGKSSLAEALLSTTPNLVESVSCTTRAKRPDEVGGSSYHFVEPARFADMLAEGAFLEHAEVFGNHYGTPRAWVEQHLQKGIDVLLVIDWQGAQQVREAMPETVGIFILPPSLETLEQRLRGRNQDSDEVIAERMRNAVDDLSHYDEFDYAVLNDDFQTALADLQAIIRARRLTKEAQKAHLKDLLNDLLA